MKKIISLLALTFFITNCTSEKHKKSLIGEWYYEEIPSMSLVFTMDTLFINSTLMTKQNWNTDGSNIYLKNVKDYMLNKLEGENYRTHFVYSLNKNSDTLVWKAKKDTTNQKYKFIKKRND